METTEAKTTNEPLLTTPYPESCADDVIIGKPGAGFKMRRRTRSSRSQKTIRAKRRKAKAAAMAAAAASLPKTPEPDPQCSNVSPMETTENKNNDLTTPYPESRADVGNNGKPGTGLKMRRRTRSSRSKLQPTRMRRREARAAARVAAAVETATVFSPSTVSTTDKLDENTGATSSPKTPEPDPKKMY